MIAKKESGRGYHYRLPLSGMGGDKFIDSGIGNCKIFIRLGIRKSHKMY
jgi:hypothetical protein